MPSFSYILDPPGSFGTMAEFERALRRLKELGYAGIEFSLPSPPGFDLDALERALTATRLTMVSFLTGWSYFNEGLCLCAKDPAIRERAVARLLGHVETAARFGAILVIGQMQGFLQDEPDSTIANDRIAECLGAVAHRAEARGVTLVLEPVNHLQVGFNHTVAHVLRMVRRVGSPALRPMVDTLHMNIEERSLTDPIRLAGADLAHVHLCETNGSIFGTSHLDFAAVLRTLTEIGYDRFISVKIYRGATWEEGASTTMAFLRTLGLV
ncbi:MAG: sugar phosphate isomerase/epimerase [Candidatus Latescibacteria bacterium]|nr:sugar phosphate isomerase/epimerase [Candidatus Latescibacterota bacterium]